MQILGFIGDALDVMFGSETACCWTCVIRWQIVWNNMVSVDEADIAFPSLCSHVVLDAA